MVRLVPADDAEDLPRGAPSVAWSVARFTVAGVVIAVALVGLTAVQARRAGADQAARSFEAVARTAAAALTPSLDVSPTAPPAVRGTLRDQVATLRRAGPITRVEVVDGTGRVLWSDVPSDVGRTTSLGPAERDALQRGVVGSTTAAAGSAGPGTAPLLEAYVGVRDLHGTPVLLTLYERPDQARASARDVWLRFAPPAVGALLLLQVVQVPLAWRLTRQLRRSLHRQHRLLRAAVGAADGERRRIAAEVHDHLVQDLTGMAYELDAARLREQPDGATDHELLGRTAERLRRTVGDARTLLVTWMPAGPPHGRLGAALRDLAAGIERSGTRVRLATEGVDDLPPDVAALVYRCVQESLRNVVAHSRATTVEVSVRAEEGQVMTTVDDNGCGFDDERLRERTSAGHLGMRALGDLVAEAGGSLTAYSGPGQGTRLVVSVPLRSGVRAPGVLR